MRGHKGTNAVLWFLAGLGIGSLVGILCAPRSRVKTREHRSQLDWYINRDDFRTLRPKEKHRYREMVVGTHDAGEPPPKHEPPTKQS